MKAITTIRNAIGHWTDLSNGSLCLPEVFSFHSKKSSFGSLISFLPSAETSFIDSLPKRLVLIKSDFKLSTEYFWIAFSNSFIIAFASFILCGFFSKSSFSFNSELIPSDLLTGEVTFGVNGEANLSFEYGDSGEFKEVVFFELSVLIFGRSDMSQRSLCSFNIFTTSEGLDFFKCSNFLNSSLIFSKHLSSLRLTISLGITAVWIKNLSELIIFNFYCYIKIFIINYIE